ncbi:hypothetical protein L596_030021 [Steinernema carpocapsae]|uniref:Uncharacterized protein n=1 Tax=Steinernema carpocapsae TaxID=34508 RepID=A0A4U5LRI0_STECR|nr:hypothetical protein L596_030021 [Steinernema carpocapsae]
MCARREIDGNGQIVLSVQGFALGSLERVIEQMEELVYKVFEKGLRPIICHVEVEEGGGADSDLCVFKSGRLKTRCETRQAFEDKHDS